MEENIDMYTANKKGVRVGRVLVFTALILTIMLLSTAGYYLYRDYQQKYSNKEPDLTLTDESTVLEPQYSEKEIPPVEYKKTHTLNQEKIKTFDALIKQSGTNTNIYLDFGASYLIQAKVKKISQENFGDKNENYTLSLYDYVGNTIDLKLSKEELEKAQIYSEIPGTITKKSFFDLKGGDNVEVEVNLSLISDTPSYYRIRVF